MARLVAHLDPRATCALGDLGARLALARGRRGLTRKHLAQRAGLTEFTLRRVEAGEASATMGAYLAVLAALGLTEDMAQVAAADPLGRDLQDAPLLAKRRRRRSAGTAAGAAPVEAPDDRSAAGTVPRLEATRPDDLSTDDLVRLLTTPTRPPAP